MKIYLLKLLFKTVRVGWNRYAGSHVPDYSGAHRQWAALIMGLSAVCPVIITVIIFKLIHEDLSGLAHAGHAGPAAILMLLMLAMGAVLILLNYGVPVLAISVIVSLTYDIYKLQSWRNSKFIALCIGVTALVGAWLWLALQTKEFFVLSLADVAPFLSSALALMLTFTTLMLLPKPRSRL